MQLNNISRVESGALCKTLISKVEEWLNIYLEMLR